MDVDEKFAKGELLDANLDDTVGILRDSKLVQGFVALN